MSEIATRVADRRAEVVAEMERIASTAMKFNRNLSSGEQSRFEALNAEADALRDRIDQLDGEAQRARAIEESFARIGGNPAAPEPRTWLPSMSEFRALLRDESRAIGTSGAFISVGASNQYFDQLRKRTSVLAAGPVIIPVSEAGSLKVPSVTASVTVSGLAENTAITPSDPTLASVTLDPIKLAAMTLVAREAVEDSHPELREVVANSLVRDAAVELDKQLITGSGAANNIRGLRNQSSLTAGPSTGANGASLTYAYLADTLYAYEGANADPDRAAWFMHSRTWNSVRKLVDSQSRPLVQVDVQAGLRPALFGKPVYISNNLSIAETAGTSSDCSSIILADMSQVVVGVSRELELSISDQYAFNSDQLALRVTARYDLVLPQPTAVTLTTGVRV